MKTLLWRSALVAIAVAGLTLTGCKKQNSDPDLSSELESADNATASEVVDESFAVADVAVSTLNTSKNNQAHFDGTRWAGASCVSTNLNADVAFSDIPAALQSFFVQGTVTKRVTLTFGAGCSDQIQRSGNIVVFWQGNWYDWANRKVAIYSGDNPTANLTAYTARGNKHYIVRWMRGSGFNFCAPVASSNPSVDVSVYAKTFWAGTDGVFSEYRANHTRTWLRGWQAITSQCNAGSQPATPTVTPTAFVAQVTDDETPIAGGPGGDVVGASGSRSNRPVFGNWTARITSPHIWYTNCRFMYSGRTVVTVGSANANRTRTITWGDVPAANPLPATFNCVGRATITIDGQTFNFNP